MVVIVTHERVRIVVTHGLTRGVYRIEVIVLIHIATVCSFSIDIVAVIITVETQNRVILIVVGHWRLVRFLLLTRVVALFLSSLAIRTCVVLSNCGHLAATIGLGGSIFVIIVFDDNFKVILVFVA